MICKLALCHSSLLSKSFNIFSYRLINHIAPPSVLLLLYHIITSLSTYYRESGCAWRLKKFSQVRICPKSRCIYGFVNNFWTGRLFVTLRKLCGGSKLSTDPKTAQKCRNASAKFWKTSESKAFSEIFGIRRMWNNSLRELWNIAPTGRNVKWNLPTFAKRIFHTPQAYFTFRRNISLARKGKFRWKKHLLAQVLFSGWDIGIRTPTYRVRVCCATVTQYPNIVFVLSNDIYYTTARCICQ